MKRSKESGASYRKKKKEREEELKKQENSIFKHFQRERNHDDIAEANMESENAVNIANVLDHESVFINEGASTPCTSSSSNTIDVNNQVSYILTYSRTRVNLKLF